MEPCQLGEPVEIASGVQVHEEELGRHRPPIDLRAIGPDLYVSWIERDGIHLATLDRDGRLLQRRRWIERVGIVEHRLLTRNGGVLAVAYLWVDSSGSSIWIDESQEDHLLISRFGVGDDGALLTFAMDVSASVRSFPPTIVAATEAGQEWAQLQVPGGGSGSVILSGELEHGAWMVAKTEEGVVAGRWSGNQIHLGRYDELGNE